MGQGETPPEIEREQLGSAICKRAANIIKTNGWSQGAHARDTEGCPCRAIAPEAASFSIYGAVMKAMYLAGLPCGDLDVQADTAMWRVLTGEALRLRGALSATSHINPLFDFNDDRQRSQAVVEAYLLDCADMLENLELTGKG